ncbi:MAG: hypothetical protein EBS95_02265 [Chitinophagia bacterium]|nr:hypothetical protein [Chitinophagia bacterium]
MNPQSAKKIRDFANRELTKMINDSKSLVVWPESEDSIGVGRLWVKRRGDQWSVPVDSVHRKDFGRKSHAVAFAMLWQKNHMAQAADLEKNDSLLSRLQSEIDLLQQRMKHALGSKNYEKFEIYRSKYSNAVAKKRHVVNQLEKTLNSTKYMKLG